MNETSLEREREREKEFTLGFHERMTLDLNDGGDRHKSRIII